LQQSQIRDPIVCTLELKPVPIAGLECFVTASNNKGVEVWNPELRLLLNIDHNCLHYQPNLPALGEICHKNPILIAEHSVTFGTERFTKQLDLTKHSPNWNPDTKLSAVNPHTGISPWKDTCVFIVGAKACPNLAYYKAAELLKGLQRTVLDTKIDFSMDSGLVVLVRPDGRTTTSWVDYSRLRRKDNCRFLHKDHEESSTPVYYSFKPGFVPSYSDQELAILSGRRNPEYEAVMAESHAKKAQRDQLEREKREKRLKEKEHIDYEKVDRGVHSPPVIRGHWILDPRLKGCLGKQSIYVTTSLNHRKDYLVSLRYGSDGQVEVWTDETKPDRLDSEVVDWEIKSQILLDQRYKQNLLVVVEGEHTGKFVCVLSVGWTRLLRCQLSACSSDWSKRQGRQGILRAHSIQCSISSSEECRSSG
jgi:hypothetical protein